MTPQRVQQASLDEAVVQAVTCAVALVLMHIVHYDLSRLSVQIIAASIAVSSGRVKQLSLHTLTPGYQQQTALLIVGNDGLAGEALFTLVDALEEEVAEMGVETKVILNNQRTIEGVVKNILRGQQVFVGATCTRKGTVHGVRLAVIDKKAVYDVRCQVFHIAVEDVMKG
jgi:hypothetical protein